MGGRAKTSTLAVTRKVLPSLYLRLKMGTALEASPKLSGNLPISMLVTVTPSCSTYLPPVNSLPQDMGGYAAGVIGVLFLEVMVRVSYGQMNHLMVMESVDHMQITQITLVTRLLLKVGRTCSLTRRMENSQSLRSKYGK
jgi:hypothetical protein